MHIALLYARKIAPKVDRPQDVWISRFRIRLISPILRLSGEGRGEGEDRNVQGKHILRRGVILSCGNKLIWRRQDSEDQVSKVTETKTTPMFTISFDYDISI